MIRHRWLYPGRISLKLLASVLVSAMSLIAANAAAATYNLVDLRTLSQGL